MPIYKVQAGHTLMIEGPASFTILEGKASCLGAPIHVGRKLVVGRPRQTPIYVSDDATIEFIPGSGGSRREVEASTIPTGWSEASEILFQTPGVALIVGAVDSGKSSLCTYLANRCLNHGLRVAVVDSDVGQSDIGPPTTISTSHLGETILGLQDLEPEIMYFVGDTSPSSVPGKLIDFLTTIIKEGSHSTDVLLVNTDGWIGDPAAIHYKSQLVTNTNPNLVLALSTAQEIDPLLALLTNTSIKLERSPYAKTRSKDERRAARESGYQRFLRDSRPLSLDLSQVKLRTFDQPKQTMLRRSMNLRGVLVGLLNEDEQLLSIGRLRHIDDEQALVETQAENSARVLELGAIMLSSKYEEIGYSNLH